MHFYPAFPLIFSEDLLHSNTYPAKNYSLLFLLFVVLAGFSGLMIFEGFRSIKEEEKPEEKCANNQNL